MNERSRFFEDVAYSRLEASLDFGNSLIGEENPARLRMILEEIIANGDKTLEQVGDSANPHLLSYTHMTMAAAQVDLANIETDEPTRKDRIHAAAEHCDIATAIALDSRTTFLPFNIMSWAMAVLANALRLSQGRQQRAIESRLSRCARDIPELLQKKQDDRLEAAKIHTTCQCLLIGAEDVENPSERTIVLQEALRMAQDAQRIFFSSGGFEAVLQVGETITKVNAALGSESP